MNGPIVISCYSDVLCVWAYVAQLRIDAIVEQFGDEVAFRYRYCSVFGDTAFKVGRGWSDRGGYEGFAAHLQKTVEPYDELEVHGGVWADTRPLSSTPAHLALKAVELIAEDRALPFLRALRVAFFAHARDIGTWPVLREVLTEVGVDDLRVQGEIESGAAFALLEADHRTKTELAIQGSPTLVLNDGRQKLYGNVGYRVIEANIKELLRSPNTGAASWC